MKTFNAKSLWSIALAFAMGLGVNIWWINPVADASAQALPQPSVALESESLTALIEQLRVAHAIVNQAEQASDQSQRINFNYPALRADLSTIELGVQQYLAGIRDSPRRIDPLGGEYRR